MNVYAFLLFGSFIITGFTFTYILAQKGNSILNQSYLLCTGIVAVWIASDFIVSTKIFSSYNLTILKLFSFSWLFVGVVFYNFIFIFMNKNKSLLFYFLMLCAVFFYFSSIFTNLIYSGVESRSWGIIEKRGVLYDIAGFFLVVFPIIYSTIRLLLEFPKIDDGMKKKQAVFICFGALLSIVTGVFTDMILPKILNGFMITASFSASILSLFVYRAVTKYQFLMIPLEETIYELFSNISNGVILLDKQNKILQINPSAFKILGLESRPEHIKNIDEILTLPESGKGVHNMEMQFKKKDGRESFLMVSITPVYKPNIATSKIIILQDITELRMRTKELEKMNEIIFKASITDVLTGLYNRQELYKRIDSEINRLERHPDISFSILFIDLDNFKYYNDTFGHPVGDIILCEISSVLNGCVRLVDFICRFGGDEFVILVTETDAEGAAQIASRILQEIKNRNYFLDIIEKNLGHPVSIPLKKRIGCSIGITQYEPASNVSSDALIARADCALYQAKRSNKSGYVQWTSGMEISQEITEFNRN